MTTSVNGVMVQGLNSFEQLSDPRFEPQPPYHITQFQKLFDAPGITLRLDVKKTLFILVPAIQGVGQIVCDNKQSVMVYRKFLTRKINPTR